MKIPRDSDARRALLRFFYPAAHAGTHTVSTVAIDLDSPLDCQARAVFAHVTSQLSKRETLRLFRSTPSKWQQRATAPFTPTPSGAALSPDLYGLLSPFLRHRSTGKVLDFEELKSFLSAQQQSTSSAELHFDIVVEKSQTLQNSQEGVVPPLPVMSAEVDALISSRYLAATRCIDASQIRLGYNTVSQALLQQQQPMKPLSAIECGKASILSTQDETLLNKLRGLQLTAKEHNMNWNEYRDNLSGILKQTSACGGSTETLAKEFELVFPRIYSGIGIDSRVEEDPHAHLHTHLHTLHVIPVLRGLASPTGAQLSPSLFNSATGPSTVTTTTAAATSSVCPKSLSSLIGLCEFLPLISDSSLVQLVPTIFCVNATSYLSEAAKFESSLLNLPLDSLSNVITPRRQQSDLPSPVSAVSSTECPPSSDALEFLHFVQHLSRRLCSSIKKEEVADKYSELARNLAKTIYHHPERAKFKDLLQLFKLLHKAYSHNLDAYISFYEQVLKNVSPETILKLKMLIPKLAPLATITDTEAVDSKPLASTKCGACGNPPSKMAVEFRDKSIFCSACYVSGKVGKDRSQITALTPLPCVETPKNVEVNLQPINHPAQTIPTSQFIGRLAANSDDFLAICLQSTDDHLKPILANLLCLRHVQFLGELATLIPKKILEAPPVVKSLIEVNNPILLSKVDSANTNSRIEAAAVATLVSSFTKELCFLLKDPKAEWMTPAARPVLSDIRRTSKIMFHRPQETTVAQLLKVLIALSETFLDKNRSNHSWVKNFVWRLVSVVLETPPQRHVLRLLLILLFAETRSSRDSARESATISIPGVCGKCRSPLMHFAISMRDGIVMCSLCWWSSDEFIEGSPIIVTSSATSKTQPSIATSHLLAHQQNMLENVLGTRKAVLPDNRQAVMSTSINEFSRVQKTSSESPGHIKEHFFRGGTGQTLEEHTTISVKPVSSIVELKASKGIASNKRATSTDNPKSLWPQILEETEEATPENTNLFGNETSASPLVQNITDIPQSPNTQDTPEMPQSPDTQDTPEMPQSPDTQATPEVPQSPDTRDTPEMPQSPIASSTSLEDLQVDSLEDDDQTDSSPDLNLDSVDITLSVSDRFLPPEVVSQEAPSKECSATSPDVPISVDAASAATPVLEMEMESSIPESRMEKLMDLPECLSRETSDFEDSDAASVRMGERPLFQVQSHILGKSYAMGSAISDLQSELLLLEEPPKDVFSNNPIPQSLGPEYEPRTSLTASDADVFKSVRKFKQHSGAHVDDGFSTIYSGSSIVPIHSTPKNPRRWQATPAPVPVYSPHQTSPTSSVSGRKSLDYKSPPQRAVAVQPQPPPSPNKNYPSPRLISSATPAIASPRFAQPLARHRKEFASPRHSVRQQNVSLSKVRSPAGPGKRVASSVAEPSYGKRFARPRQGLPL
eukprot:Gregarina_sp_Poly_1__8819@NODE_52_length_17545_cov_128_515219_g44_i0_p2_GENE_NODE_52_length_17545_cov_128_515219_g44_i0NODE_52_length_17545_cov_128_515219_g44_i0_p2_ORF_typecomplete_len1423_score254_65LIM/PF00412_22/5_1LIM/PF00412_22/4_4_NODE_52_length_17545_cov_128_515219_g44_i09685236